MSRPADAASRDSAAHPDTFPLRSAQARIVFLEQLQPSTPHHLIPMLLRIDGPLDVNRLERIVGILPDHMPVLRMAFERHEDDWRQRVRTGASFEFEIHDLRDTAPDSHEKAVLDLVRHRLVRPFTLGSGPYHRYVLLRTAQDQWVFGIAIHRLLGDESLLTRLYRLLVCLYEGLAPPEVSPDEDVTRATLEERAYLESPKAAADAAYWRGYLAGAPDGLDLPTDFPRPSLQRLETHRTAFAWPRDLATRLESAAASLGTHSCIPYLAAVAVLLFRYTRHPELVIGLTIPQPSNGTLRQQTITTPLRVSLMTFTPFRDLMVQIKRQLDQCIAHASLPFDVLLEAVQPERNLSRAPVFQVALEWRATTCEPVRGAHVSFTPNETDFGWSELDLAIVLHRAPKGVAGYVEMGAALFDPATAARAARHLELLLHGATQTPESPINALPLLPPEERERLLITWNAETLEYPRNACIHQLIGREAVRYPDHIALIWNDQRIAYGDLDRRANRLAHFLKALGVGPEVFVGVCMERRPELLIALLAVMKAGGAYVPLDPRYPADRIAFMLNDTQAPVVLTDASLAPTLPAGSSEILALDALWETIDHLPDSPPESEVTSENLAYVIYTSGSTGVPKGVAIAHRPAIALFFWARRIFSDTELRGMLASTSICFDLSVFELFLPLCFGGRVVLVGNVLELLELPAANEVTIINTVPSAMNELIRLDGVPESVTTVCLAGEPLTAALAEAIYRVPQVAQLYNLYGPSEDTTYSTWALVPREPGSVVTIGRPIGNTQAYVLDPDMQPAPIGVPGELYLGGDGLAREYLNRPELTAERFVENVFDRESSTRLYRTGDLVKYLPDGQLLFLGRLDHQVKIRGFRIELGEIQSVLERHEDVSESAVVVREDVPGDKRIVAYVVTSPGCGPDVLRRHLGEFVPQYMVPSSFVFLDALPRTPNGKLDRKALPAPSAAEGDSVDEAHSDPLQEAIAAIWRELLGVAGVRPSDSFFALGGHSLLATQLTARLRHRLGCHIPLRLIFEHAVLAPYAAAVESLVDAGDADGFPPIMALPYTRPEPLSFAQEGLWFLEQLHPGLAAYVIPVAYRLRGTVDLDALQRAVNHVIAAHEALRTAFVMHEGEPVQVVYDNVHVDVPLFNVHHLPADARERDVWRQAAEVAAQPFNLAEAPLVRATLYRLFEDDYVLLMPQHHIVSDGWSLNILTRDLAAAYDAARAGKLAVPESRLQYRDYARWQRSWLHGDRLERLLAYWRQRLAGAPPVIELLTDLPRPATPQYQGAREPISFSATLSRDLGVWCREESATPFTVLLAAIFVLFYRYTGQRNLVLGTAVANRNRKEWEDVFGYFVNSLPIHAQLDEGVTFRDFVRRFHDRLLEDLEHQELPFDKIVEDLLPDRDASRHPLFQIMVVLQNTPAPVAEAPGVQFAAAEWDNGTAKFDLTFSLHERQDGIDGYLEYDTALFKAVTMRRMVVHLRQLLQSVVANPTATIDALSIIGVDEQRLLLDAWAETRSEYPRNATLGELFESQVARTPEAVAVSAVGDQWTYRELNQFANRVAHVLLRRGVTPGTGIGLCGERSPRLVAAILGIVKSGGAYVPIDPGYPAERIAFMIRNSGVQLMLHDAPSEHALPECDVPRLSIEAILADETAPIENPPSAAAPTDLAYIMYTSGSTGTPKGVRVGHRAIVRLVCNTNYISVAADDAFLLMAPISFDASTFEVWGPLLHGARLAVMPPGHVSLEQLHQVIRDERITVLWLTAGLFHLVVEEKLEALRPLRWLLAGGDVLRPEAVLRCLRALPHCTVVNGYGPTENTTFTCCFPMTSPEQVGQSVSIGRPIANTSVYVLDARLQPVPIGVPGELYTGGDGLAQGYHGLPDLTAECFVSNPFSNRPGARLYRTGDRVRYRDDGTLEFLGRIDTQLKIRGFRIEPEEIELAAMHHPAVRSAAVIATARGGEEKHLVVFAVAVGVPPSANDVLAFLRGRLPEFMVPSALHWIDRLPLSPNGKVDRNQLAACAGDERQVEGHRGEEPVGAVEQDVARLWRDLLHVEFIGRCDNFFAMGGHSLLATQLCARLRSLFGFDVPIRTVFEHSALQAFAEAIATLEHTTGAETLPPMQRVPREDTLPLSYTQRRLWFLEQLLPGTPAYVIPTVLRLEGTMNPPALRAAANAVLARHEVLRTVFGSDEGNPVVRILERLEANVRVTDLMSLDLHERESTVAKLLAVEAATPFDLANGPLIRFHLVAVSDQTNYLLMPVHHIVSDGWSQQILVRDLLEFYETAVQSKGRVADPVLPALQYVDYAAWQRSWLHGSALHRRLTYWRTHLDRAPLVLELPADYLRPPVQRLLGRRHNFELEPDTAARLRAFSRDQGVTTYVVLLATFCALLHKLTSVDDLIVGSVIANRQHPDTESMIGFFANTLALRARLDGETTFENLLRRVHNDVIAAHEHQDLPLDALVEAMNPRRDRSRSPLIQVIFSLNHVAQSEWKSDGLRAAPLEVDNGSSKFDLSLLMEERPGGIGGFFEYNTDLFKGETIARWETAFQQLLNYALVNAESPIAALVAQPPMQLPEPPDARESVIDRIMEVAAQTPGVLACGNYDDFAVVTPAIAARWLAERSISENLHDLCITGDFVPAALVQRLLRETTLERVVAWHGIAQCACALAAVCTRDNVGDHIDYRAVAACVAVHDIHGHDRICGVPGTLAIRDDAGQWSRTGDCAIQNSDGSFRLLGSSDNIHRDGGVWINPREIENVIWAHPAVRDVAVTRVDGTLAAFVAIDPASGAELEPYMRARLCDAVMPARIVRVDALPLTSSGLHDLDSLPPLLTPAEPETIADANAMEESLTPVWQTLLQTKKIDRHDNFFDLGGHSLLATQLLARLRKEFGWRITLDDIYAQPTIAGLVRFATKPADAPRVAAAERVLDPCLVPIKASGSRIPFFCVSGAGGPVFSYFNLAPYLHAEQPFYGMQAPSLDDRSQHFDTLEDLAAYYVRAIQGLQPTGPYLIGGWSFGGAVAFEIARQLCAAGMEVAFVGLIDAEATLPPSTWLQRFRLAHRLIAEKIRGRATMTLHTVPLLARYIRDGLRMLKDRALGRDSGNQVAFRDYIRWVIRDQASQYFLKQAKVVQLDPLTSRSDVLNDDRVRLITNVFTANESMLRRYRFDTYSGPVTLFRVKHDPWRRRKLLGWDEVTTRVDLHEIEGNHLVIFRAPFVQELGEQLDRCLARAQGR